MSTKAVVAVLCSGGLLLSLGGCADKMSRSLGALPVVVTRASGVDQRERDEFLKVSESGSDVYLVEVMTVDFNGVPTTTATTQTGVYRVADISALNRHFFLGLNPEDEAGLKKKRAVIAMKLMEIADTNGAEYWRRFSGLMEYKKGLQAGEKALMGAGIASTFISPVVGASLTGAGLAFDATTTQLTAGFDIETYSSLREAVRAAVINRKEAIRRKLELPYMKYPATAVVAEIADYAHVYSVRGAVDALKASTATATRVAEENSGKP